MSRSGELRRSGALYSSHGLHRRHRADLDQKLLAYQAVDDEQRVGRIGAAGEQAREFARAVLRELRDVLGMHEIARELDDVAKVRALRGERRADVGEHLRALAVEIGWRLAVPVVADLSGDEQKLRRLDARDVRISRERLAEAVWIEHLDIGHGRLREVVVGGAENLLHLPLEGEGRARGR